MDAPIENTPSKTAVSIKWKPLLNRLRNKYLLSGLFFMVWMLFFDPKDLGSVVARWKKYNELKISEQHLVEQISQTKSELAQLKTNAQTIEKYAREKYLMKKDNEELFVTTEVPKENEQ